MRSETATGAPEKAKRVEYYSIIVKINYGDVRTLDFDGGHRVRGGDAKC
jgi:hypothetical protein